MKVKEGIVRAGLDSARYSKVTNLPAERKARLDQFPEGAFEDNARRQLSLADFSTDGTLAGYLLYRIAVSKNRAAIIHLTTSGAFRDKDVSGMSAEPLKAETIAAVISPHQLDTGILTTFTFAVNVVGRLNHTT